MTSHFPPPEKDGGGATASKTAWISAAILSGRPSRKSMVGTRRAGSSSVWRWKKWMSHGSGIDITASQTSNELLDLCYNRADGCEVGGGKRPCDRDGERD